MIKSSNWDRSIFFLDLEQADWSKHGTVVFIQLGLFILESDNLETLSTKMASMNWSLSNHIVHFLVSMWFIFNTRSHADNNSPWRVRSENQDWVINSSKLRVNSCFHFVPLMHFKWVSCNICTQVSSSITMLSITIRKCRFPVSTIWFSKWLNVSIWDCESFFDLLKYRQKAFIAACCHFWCAPSGSEKISGLKPFNLSR